MLKLFLNINIADFFSDSEYYIFRAVTSIKKSGKYKLRNYGTLSFSRARELLLKVWISPKLGFIALGLGALLRLSMLVWVADCSRSMDRLCRALLACYVILNHSSLRFCTVYRFCTLELTTDAYIHAFFFWFFFFTK